MVVKATPSAAFEVSQPQFLLEFLVVSFNDPSLFGQSQQFAQRDRCGQVG